MNVHEEHIIFKYLSNELDAAELKIFKDALAQDHSLQGKVELQASLLGLTDAYAFTDFNVESNFKSFEKSITRNQNYQRVRRRYHRLTFAYVAAIAFIAVGTFIHLYFQPTIISSPNSQITALTLPDNSVVTLYPGSKIKYQRGYGDKHRNLVLNGHAYFEVTKNNTPFVIQSHHLHTEVKGTAFDVLDYASSKSGHVTVTEGLVSVSAKGNEKNVAPDHQLIFSENENGLTFNLKPESGFHKQVISTDASLTDIINLYKHHFNVYIGHNLDSETLYHISFDVTDKVESLNTLNALLDGKLQKTERGYLIKK